MATDQTTFPWMSEQPRKSKRLTAEEKTVVLADYAAGGTMEAIAARLGTSMATVCRLVKAAGLSRSNLVPIPIGKEYDSLTVLRHLGGSRWLCRCVCGREEEADGTALRQGRHVRCKACRKPEALGETKKCAACGEVLPATAEYFWRNKQFRLGLTARCKKCRGPKVREDARERLKGLRLEVLTHYSGGEPRCACCGETVMQFLALDHLEGSSREDYAKHGNSERLFSSIRREGYKLKAQVLCHNCNECKGRYGYCVHQPEPADACLFYDTRKTKPRIVLPEPTETHIAEAGGESSHCKLCGTLYPRSATFFPKHPQMADGLLNRCKECDRIDHYQQGQARRQKYKAAVLAHYCGSVPHCACCGITVAEFLTVDHVRGGGLKHRREQKINNLWRWLIVNNFPPDEYQILCYSCNLAKGFYGSCPHGRTAE